MAEHVHYNGFEHLNLDLSSISPRHQYHLSEKSMGPDGETYLTHFIWYEATEGDGVVAAGRFRYGLHRDYWNDMAQASDADRALLRQLAHAQLLDDLAAFEAGELLPNWFADSRAPDPEPKFLIPA